MMKTRLNRALATCLVFAMMLSIMSVCAGAVSDPSAPEAKVQMSNTEVQANNDATMDAKALLQKMGISGDAATCQKSIRFRMTALCTLCSLRV